MKFESECMIHSKVEEADSPFLICIECGHIYETKEDLQKQWDHDRDMTAATEVIIFCPFCLHDFPFDPMTPDEPYMENK